METVKTYPAGSSVMPQATPGADSTFDGWDQPVPVTIVKDQEVKRTATFTKKPVVPPVTGPWPDLKTIAKNVFVPLPVPSVPTGTDTTPYPAGGGSKHQRLVSNRQGLIYTGFGDTNPSKYPGNPSQGQGYRLTLATGAWFRWETVCRPAGQLKPCWPDEVIWAYLPAKAPYPEGFMLLGGVTQGTDGQICQSSDGPTGCTLYRTGLFFFPLGPGQIAGQAVVPEQWMRWANVPGTNALWGHFDSVKRQLLWMGGTGGNEGGICGSALHRLDVDALFETEAVVIKKTPLCLSAKPWPGTPNGTFESFADVRDNSAYALDEVGRTLYVLGYHVHYVGGAPVPLPGGGGDVKTLVLWPVNIDTGAIGQPAFPPTISTQMKYRNQDAQDIVFASKSRQVVIPYTRTHCGVIENLLTYHVDTKQWTEHPVNSFPNGKKPRGNTAIYDPEYDVTIVAGSVACADWGFPDYGTITEISAVKV